MSTPLWIDLLGPVSTLAGIVVAFLFGRVQGRTQTRYVKAAEILTELRRLVLEIEMHALQIPKETTEEDKAVLLEAMFEEQVALMRHLETHALWLPRPVRDRVDSVLREFTRTADSQRPDDVGENFDAEDLDTRLRSLFVELAVETERLLGTGPPWWKPWLLTRKGRLRRYTP